MCAVFCQTHLAAHKFDDACAVLQRVGVSGIDFTRVYAPAPPFVTYLHHWCHPAMTATQRRELFDTFVSAGIVTRQTLSATFEGEHKHNVLAKAVRHVYSAAFEFLLAHAPADAMDWTAMHPSGASPLLLGLKIAFMDGTPTTPLTEEQRDVFDRRAVRLITMLPDHALNAIDCTGHTPITRAIKNARVLALEALLRRLPAVELQPELRLMPPSESAAAVVSVTQALTASNAPAATFLTLRPRVAALVCAARVAMQHYTAQLQALVSVVLRKARLPTELVAIAWSYLA